MTIHHLRIFIAVAEQGSMNAAAKKLFVTQPTVSQAIRELEVYYDTILFDRLGKRIMITESGMELLREAYKAVGQFDRLEENMRKNAAHSSLRVGGTITVGANLLSLMIRDFEIKFPEADTYAFVGNTAQIEEKLLNSELDIALVEGRVQAQGLVSVPEIKDFLVLACSLDHPFAKYEKLPVSWLNGQKYVMREKGSGTRELFDQFIRENHLEINKAWEATSPDTFRSAILNNNCLAVISVRLLQRDIENGDIKIFVPEGNEFQRTFNLVYHKDKIPTRGMQVFTEIVNSHRQPDWLNHIKIGTLIHSM